ncbi:phosphoglucosamine mutase [Halobaculum sp. MBLA0147]|uniref:phosphoglucosamine mutase n=1 Tax=Halobaculum sp. MBLA0147 TaxID=3079934 RepID=UPI003526B304
MFGTSGVRGPIGEEITAETALAVGRALPSCGYDHVVVGRDPRETGAVLVDALASGVRECGGDVVELGLAATPTVARSVAELDADAGVSVTASHNPAPDNGLKLWTPSGQAFDERRRGEITACVENEAWEFADWDAFGDRRRDEDATERHRDALVAAVRGATSGSETALSGGEPSVATPLDETVVVDVGNGAGGVTAVALDRLGCSVQTLNGQPDGRFPGRPSEPTAENCALLQTTVANSPATVGIAHDGDADRTMVVDETGGFVSGDALLAILAREAAAPGDTVAVPVDTSLAVDDTLAEHDVHVTRTAVGDVFVAEAASEDGVVFGGEPSGAWIWPDETLCPDGPLAACHVVELVAREGSLSALADGVASYPIHRENVETDRKTAVMERVAELASERYPDEDVTTLDGIRVARESGWFLIRDSGTQPLIRVTAEAREETAASRLREEVSAMLDSAQA